MDKDTIFIAIFSLFSVILMGQSLERANFEVWKNNEILAGALDGGMNLPQFSDVDLDHDGVKDLFVFDKAGNALSTFKSVNGGYQFAPELLEFFPKLNKWALMLDYNGDGAPDIFAFSSQLGIAGAEVHKGHWEGNKLAFDKLDFGQLYDVLYYQSNSGSQVNLYISNIDIPAITDVDGDGDMDILTFASNGGYVNYYQNFSQEQGFGADTLIFKLVDNCWGKFFESGLSTKITLSNDPNTCAEAYHGGGSGGHSRHIGSTLLAMDVDNDGDKELFLGDVSYNNVVLLFNTGTAQQAYMTAQDTLFPNGDTHIDISVFPGIFAVDVNHDGNKDVISAPSSPGASLSTDNAWYYKNGGTTASTQFTFQQNDLLVGEMIDLGTGAYPAIADIDGDGLKDMLIGNETYFTASGNPDSRLHFYKNIGNIYQPKFQLEDNDYLQLSELGATHSDYRPTFGDLDGDGDLDLMVGDFMGGILYFENTAGPDAPMVFAPPIINYMDIDIGLAASPCIIDADGDGLADLIIGERNGNLNFIKNIGSSGSPNFGSNHEASPNNPFWGQVDTRDPGNLTGYSVPQMWSEDGVLNLFCGSYGGRIIEYGDIENNLTGTFTVVDDDYGQVIGGQTFPAFEDLNNDGLRELILGNRRGGIEAFKTTLPQPVGLIDANIETLELAIEPNPTLGAFVPYFGASPFGKMTIYDMSGRLVKTDNVTNGQEVKVPNLKKGSYLVKVISNSAIYVSRLVVD